MTCTLCDKEFNAGKRYCPHCSLATEPPTEAENMDMGDMQRQFREGLFIMPFILAGIGVGVALYTKETWILFMLLLIGALVGIPSFFVHRYRVWKERQCPLIKRAAVVQGKERTNAGKRRIVYYATFIFPDHTEMRLKTTRSAYKDLNKRDRVLLKYKVTEEAGISNIRQKANYFGYERR